MHIRRWTTAGILGALTLALLATVIVASDGWTRILAALALLTAAGTAVAVAHVRHRAGIALVMGHVRQILDDAPERSSTG